MHPDRSFLFIGGLRVISKGLKSSVQFQFLSTLGTLILLADFFTNYFSSMNQTIDHFYLLFSIISVPHLVTPRINQTKIKVVKNPFYFYLSNKFTKYL